MTGLVKKRKVSKKNKSSWRKHVDVKDVDEFLEEQRLDERLGYSISIFKTLCWLLSFRFVSKLADDELFQIDTQSSTEGATLLSEKEIRRQKLEEKPVNCFSLLVPHTKVPDPIKRR